MAGRKTPVMQQFAEAKSAHPDAILFFRMGDFYEMFEDDAVLAARLLDLTLTSRSKGKPDEVPMAGVPHHAAHGYIARLLELGYKVAICEQMADPSKVKGIVPREVVRVITPGLVTELDQLDAATNNWLVALDAGLRTTGIALLDVSTGELAVAELDDSAALFAELGRVRPREVLVGTAREGDPARAEFHERERSELESSLSRVLAGTAAVRSDRPLEESEIGKALGGLSPDAEHVAPAARRAAGRALRFARDNNPGSELPVRRIAVWDPSNAMSIDAVAQAHLELVDSMSGAREATLLRVIDRTHTPPGARLLRRRLLAPLVDIERIRRRLDQVELFVINPRLRDQLGARLSEVGDLERLIMRASFGRATPRDLGALRDGLQAAAQVVELLGELDDAASRETLGLAGEPVDLVDDVAAELERALVERPPAQPKEGGVFRAEFDDELRELGRLRKGGAERMVELEARLRQETGIATLKVRYTRVFGWYIEVTKSQLARVPEGFRRKQTVAAGERYTLPELDDLADRIATAEERHRERELELLGELVRRVAAAAERVGRLAGRIARWDVAAGLAEVAHRYDYTRPEVDDSDVLEVVDGRHPVVERLAAAGRFVPNDVHLETGAVRLWLITGPNMAGKSTLLRQVALTAILAQMGSYVPARTARIGVVDRVLSRVGASDNLARGESTFMVEMRETAGILRGATRRSLVILDEIGRGTSTFDGLAIAWAVAEYLDEVIGCRALFATHYHELTALADASGNAENHSVSAREIEGDIVFLHRLVPGPASQSYGVAVARLAGLPESVLARARAVLASLESGAANAGEPTGLGKPQGRGKSGHGQLELFTPVAAPSAAERETLDTLRALEVERLTPLEALSLLARLKERL